MLSFVWKLIVSLGLRCTCDICVCCAMILHFILSVATERGVEERGRHKGSRRLMAQGPPDTEYTVYMIPVACAHNYVSLHNVLGRVGTLPSSTTLPLSLRVPQDLAFLFCRKGRSALQMSKSLSGGDPTECLMECSFVAVVEILPSA